MIEKPQIYFSPDNTGGETGIIQKRDELIEKLKEGDINKAIETKDNFNIPKEILESQEVLAAAKEGIIVKLKRGSIDTVIKIKDTFNLPKEMLESQEVLDAAKEGIIYQLKEGWINDTIETKDAFNLPKEMLDDAAKEGIIALLKEGYIGDVIETKDAFNLPKEMLESQEVLDAAKEGIIYQLKKRHINEAIQTKDAFNLPKEILESQEVLDAAKEGIIYQLKRGYIGDVIKIKDTFNLPKEMLESQEVLDAAKEGIIYQLKKRHINEAIQTKDTFNLPKEMLDDAAKEGIIYQLKKRHINEAIETKDAFNLPKEMLESQEVLDAAKEGIIYQLEEGLKLEWGNIHEVIKTKDAFNLPKEMLDDAAKEGIIFQLNKGDSQNAIEIKNSFNLSKEMLDDAAKEAVIAQLKKGNIGYAIETKDVLNIDEETWEKAIEGSIFQGKQTVLNKIVEKQDLNDQESEDLYEVYKQMDIYNQEVGNWIRLGADSFTMKNILKYIDYDFSQAHDRVQFMGKICDVAKDSGLSPQQFYGNIMQQVKMDGSSYEDNDNSYQHFNIIINAFSCDKADDMIAEAKKYQDIEKMQELIENLSGKTSIFSSWKNLKKFHEITELLNRASLLEKLKKIKDTNEKQYKYFETLLFHPNISTNAVINLFENPASFFDVSDSHSGELHESKKPSNYFEIPNLDLTAENLRDAIIEGSLDKIQSFRPFEVVFEIPKQGHKEVTLSKDLIKMALGSRTKNIEGQALNPKKLFSELNTYLKKKQTNLVKFLESQDEISEDMSDDISEIVFSQEFGMKKTTGKGDLFKAKINLKSDPDGVVAGDDTSCCMPFGSGKNNLYTANPMCALFTVQKLVGDNTWRTVAQSVLTKNIDAKKGVPQILDDANNSSKGFDEVLPEDILINSQKYIVCDNIEVARNFTGNTDVLSKIYAKFFYEYLKNNEEDFDKSRLIIGQGYTDASFGNTVENTFLPVTPVAYSDNTDSRAMELVIEDVPAITSKIAEIENPRSDTLKQKHSIKNIESLTYEDSLQTAYLESKVYTDNKNLITNLHNMENGLIAKDINNSLKGRSNLSLKYVSPEGKMLGYILAYEGEHNNEPVIYISDLASTRDNPAIGGKLILSFIDLYKKNYIEQGKTIKILAQARESTSYPLIKKGIDSFSKKLGKKVVLKEISSYNVGEDTMHEIEISFGE